MAELFYYIPNKDELFENLNEYYKEDVKTKGIITKPTKVRPEFKIEISEISLNILYFTKLSSSSSEQSGGANNTYVKYGRYIRKINMYKSKKKYKSE